MAPQQFIAKWKRTDLSERSAYQQHFLNLCDLLGQPKPAGANPEGAWYTFERGVPKAEGGNGWADVWMKGHFGWEYKGKHKNLAAAYKQLLLYREDLENPPLLVVCDLDRFEVHTNFTGTLKVVHTLLEPVVMRPLRREWAVVKAKCDELSPQLPSAKAAAAKRKKIQQRDKTLRHFVERLAHVTIPDPACGSGNFLYVALHLLLDLEKEVISFAARHGIGLLPQVRPTQLAGIEINAYAQELVSSLPRRRPLSVRTPTWSSQNSCSLFSWPRPMRHARTRTATSRRLGV